MAICPFCKETIDNNSTICQVCGRDLSSSGNNSITPEENYDKKQEVVNLKKDENSVVPAGNYNTQGNQYANNGYEENYNENYDGYEDSGSGWTDEEFPWIIRCLIGTPNPAKNTDVLPYEEAEKFNWGAFLNGIWTLSIKECSALRCISIKALMFLIPILGFPIGSIIIAYYLGKYGNRIAWKYKRWESFEEFDKVQRGWATFSILWFAASFVLSVISFFVNAFMNAMLNGFTFGSGQ